MATSRGRADVKRFFDAAPGKVASVLHGAARAGAEVIVDEIKLRTVSEDVREDVRMRTQPWDGRNVVVKIDIKSGWGRSVAYWLEYGTSPHFISVDDSVRAGRSARRINKLVDEGIVKPAGTLIINGKPVGATVFHPGAKPHPFFRVALDLKRAEAIAKAQSYIDANIGHNGGPMLGDEGDDE